eukprot:gene1600-12725_t
MKLKIIFILICFIYLINGSAVLQSIFGDKFPKPEKRRRFSIENCQYRRFRRSNHILLGMEWQKGVCWENSFKYGLPCNKTLLNQNRFTISYFKPYQVRRIMGFKHQIPMCCPHKEKFNYTKLSKELKDDLKKYWTDMDNDESNYNNGTWAHHWKLYGSCFERNKQLNTPEKYFRKAIEIFKKFDFTNIINKYYDGFPSSEYQLPIYELRNIMINQYKAQPTFSCFYEKEVHNGILLTKMFLVLRQDNFKPLPFLPSLISGSLWKCSRPDLILTDSLPK